VVLHYRCWSAALSPSSDLPLRGLCVESEPQEARCVGHRTVGATVHAGGMHPAHSVSVIVSTAPSHFWDGFGGAVGGAVIGGAVSAVVAWRVVVATQQSSERSERLKASREAAGQLTVALLDTRQRLKEVVLLSTYSERKELRRAVADMMALQFAIHRPVLSDEHLRSLAADTHDVLFEFVDRCQRPEDAVPKRPGFAGRQTPGRRNLWQAAAIPVISAYISTVVERLEQHRQGKRVDSDPIPAPAWPDVDPPLEAPTALRSGVPAG
jgi:hypothetical protein